MALFLIDFLFFMVSIIIYSGDESNYSDEEEDGGEEEEESVCERVISLLKGGFQLQQIRFIYELESAR